MSDKKWWLDVKIPVGGASLAESDFDFLSKLMKFMAQKFTNECDSGTGFGFRDYNYPLLNEGEGAFLAARIKHELGQEYGEDLVKMCKFEVRQY